MSTFSIQPDRPAVFRVAFPADLKSARAATLAIRGFLAEHGVVEGELFSCEVCLADACNNAIEYAEGKSKERPIAIEASCSASVIELRVTDHTAGFDWPERIALPSPDSERGRGLFIIDSMTDEVHYLRGNDENVLVMRMARLGESQTNKDEAAEEEEDLEKQLADSQEALGALERKMAYHTEAFSLILRWSGKLSRNSSNGDFRDLVLGDLQRLAAADWYVLRLLSPKTNQLTVVSVSDRKLQAEPIALKGVGGAPGGHEAAAALEQAPAYYDARKCADHFEPLRAAGSEARGVVYPLISGGSLVGTLAVGRRKGDFSVDEIPGELMRVASAFLAMPSANQRPPEEDARRNLVARELEIGHKIQQALLPFALPEMPGFGLAGNWESAREIGGDFYDAVALSDRALLLMIADVMGKGVPAALFATHMRGVLRGLSVRTEDPAQLLSRLNRLLYAELSAVNMFVTALVVTIDISTRIVTAASAGHCPPLYCRAGPKTVSAMPTEGIPLGILPDTVYRSVTAVLGSPGLLFVHTDGLTEARNPAGEMFGQQRLIDWLRDNSIPGRSATELRSRLATHLSAFRGGNAMVDDQAFLVFAEEGSPAQHIPFR